MVFILRSAIFDPQLQTIDFVPRTGFMLLRLLLAIRDDIHSMFTSRKTKMMIMLRDDRVIEIFGSPTSPPEWIEGMDIENGEYQFCDDIGQIYIGQISKPSTAFRQASWSLQPLGKPNIRNLVELVNKAETIEPNEQFTNIETLKNHTTRVGGYRENAD